MCIRDRRLHYRKKFTLPEGFKKSRVLLHFGAVDQECSVFVNGIRVGGHKGGYLPFHFDITDSLRQGEMCIRDRDRAGEDGRPVSMGEISTFGLELFSSSQIFYKGRARFINLPATDGGHTFLPHHENVIIALVPGTTKIVTETGEEITAVTGSGFAEMINNRVQVFVHSAEHPGEIDINRDCLLYTSRCV